MEEERPPLTNYFDLETKNHLKIDYRMTNFTNTIDNEQLNKTKEDLDIKKVDREESSLSFDVETDSDTLAAYKKIDYLFSCFYSPYTLLSLQVNHKDISGISFQSCCAGIVHQYDKNTRLKLGLKGGDERSLLVGGTHAVDENL